MKLKKEDSQKDSELPNTGTSVGNTVTVAMMLILSATTLLFFRKKEAFNKE